MVETLLLSSTISEYKVNISCCPGWIGLSVMLLAVVALSAQCPASVQFTSPAPNVSISDIAQWAQKLLMMVKLDLDGVWRLVASCRQSPYLTWRHHYQQPHTLMVQCLCH